MSELGGRGRAAPVVMLVMVALVAVLGLATTASSAAGAECANEALRRKQADAFLPDCRAYELVSPVGTIPEVILTGTGLELGRTAGALASDASNGAYAGAIGWASYYPYPGATSGGVQFLSTRTSDGWVTSDVTPKQSTGDPRYFECTPFAFFSPTLEFNVVSANRESESVGKQEEEYCPQVEPVPLVSGEPEGVQNLFLHDNTGNTYGLVNLTPEGVVPAIATFQDASANFDHALFSEEAKLTTEAPAGEDLYEWVGGSVKLVGVLPDGTPTAAAVANATAHTPELAGVNSSPVGGAKKGAASFTHAMSSDGSRVVLETGGKLYLRVNASQSQSAIAAGGKVNGEQCTEAAKACTVQVDASQSSGTGGGGTFLWANAEDTKIFFMDAATAGLTADTQAGSGENLYEYSLAPSADVGTLTDLTPTTNAEVAGVSGFGEEEGRADLYFVSNAVLSGANVEGRAPQAGQPNLYLIEEGDPSTYITTLEAGNDSGDWAGSGEAYAALSVRVSPNGRFIGFDTVTKPTGYDNLDVNTGNADTEIYLYEVNTGHLSCVSCDPAGVRPSGPAGIRVPEFSGTGESPGYLQRNVLDSGQVFFDSPDALMPQDVNGQQDVYEYIQGALHLISSGTSTAGSYFYEATPNGANVFFVTAQSLVGRDTDNAISLYDAREGAGFEEAPTPVACESEGCRGSTGSSAEFGQPASVTFDGPGNLAMTVQNKAPKKMTRAQKLARALKACALQRGRRRREQCRRIAQRRFGTRKSTMRLNSARNGAVPRKGR